ncbi:unnamed protein product [Lathyrus oleraceus]
MVRALTLGIESYNEVRRNVELLTCRSSSDDSSEATSVQGIIRFSPFKLAEWLHGE